MQRATKGEGTTEKGWNLALSLRDPKNTNFDSTKYLQDRMALAKHPPCNRFIKLEYKVNERSDHVEGCHKGIYPLFFISNIISHTRRQYQKVYARYHFALVDYDAV